MPKIASLLLVGFLSFSSAARAEVSVLGFQAWKKERVDEAKAGLEKLQLQEKPVAVPGKSVDRKAESSSARLMSSARGARTDQKLQQALLNVEIAQEMTVNDYFVLYLSQFRQREAFVEAAKKLNADEAADLMISYQRSLGNLGGEQDLETTPPVNGTRSNTQAVSR